jgi:two-component system, cell cycle sensor histidine kinase and response regulator CckA
LNYGPSGPPKISEEMATFTPTPDVMKEAIRWNYGLDQELSGGAKIILFVEDEAFVRNVTAEVLRSAGYRVLTARNAEEALVAYREYPGAVDLLLSDVILPGETGLTLAARLRHEDSELKVLFVTGYAEQLGRCRSEHAECLAKPFSKGALLQKIKQMFDTRQAAAGEHPRVKHACGNA